MGVAVAPTRLALSMWLNWRTVVHEAGSAQRSGNHEWHTCVRWHTCADSDAVRLHRSWPAACGIPEGLSDCVEGACDRSVGTGEGRAPVANQAVTLDD